MPCTPLSFSRDHITLIPIEEIEETRLSSREVALATLRVSPGEKARRVFRPGPRSRRAEIRIGSRTVRTVPADGGPRGPRFATDPFFSVRREFPFLVSAVLRARETRHSLPFALLGHAATASRHGSLVVPFVHASFSSLARRASDAT